MGSNYLYAIIEQQIIGAYDLGVLTPELADVLCKAVGNSDIDSGGSMGLSAKDGKDMEDILMDLFLPGNPYPNPADFEGYSSRAASVHAYDVAADEWQDKFFDLAKERWGWR